jgi:hypothetical protein
MELSITRNRWKANERIMECCDMGVEHAVGCCFIDVALKLDLSDLNNPRLSLRFLRRRELLSLSWAICEFALAVESGDSEKRLAHPVIDLPKSMGSGTCVEVCSEFGILDLLHGQADV